MHALPSPAHAILQKNLKNDFVERAVFFNGRSTYKLKRANLALEG